MEFIVLLIILWGAVIWQARHEGRDLNIERAFKELTSKSTPTKTPEKNDMGSTYAESAFIKIDTGTSATTDLEGYIVWDSSSSSHITISGEQESLPENPVDQVLKKIDNAIAKK